MAEWSAKKVKKDCEACERLADPKSFARGTKVKIFEAFDCANCEVTKSQPIWENENIIELYNALPSRYEGVSGIKYITASDIKFVLGIFNVPKELWDDYYFRLKYFCDAVVTAHTDREMKKKEKDKVVEDWKKSKRELPKGDISGKRFRSKMTH